MVSNLYDWDGIRFASSQSTNQFWSIHWDTEEASDKAARRVAKWCKESIGLTGWTVRVEHAALIYFNEVDGQLQECPPDDYGGPELIVEFEYENDALIFQLAWCYRS